MTIQRMFLPFTGEKDLFVSGPVYTVYKGRPVRVGIGYHKSTLGETIAQAYGNAVVRLQILSLCDKLSMSPSAAPRA